MAGSLLFIHQTEQIRIRIYSIYFRGPPEKPHSGHVVFDRWDLVRFMMQDARTLVRTPARVACTQARLTTRFQIFYFILY